MRGFATIRARYRERQRIGAEHILQRGKSHFVWIRGVLFFGGFMFVTMTTLEYWREPHHLTGWPTLGFLLFSLLLYGFGGYVGGLWMWKRIERIARRQAQPL
jgi:hypothetical protein